MPEKQDEDRAGVLKLVGAIKQCEPADATRAVLWLKDAVESLDRLQRVEYAVAVAWQDRDGQERAQDIREACDRVRGVVKALEELLRKRGPRAVLDGLSVALRGPMPVPTE